MQLLPGWHPLIVHFPLALIVTAAVALTAGQGWRNPRVAETLAIVGTWNLCLGAVGVLFALGSGLAAAIDLHVGPATHQAISAHVKSAILTAFLVLAVALWRGVGVASTSRPSWIFLILLWLATASLTVTGYRGGQNVYRYGVGVSALMERESP